MTIFYEVVEWVGVDEGMFFYRCGRGGIGHALAGRFAGEGR